MRQLTIHKMLDRKAMSSGGNHATPFIPNAFVLYTVIESTVSLLAPANEIVEMIHWLLDQDYLFAWDSPSLNTFYFYFANETEAVHFTLSHQ